MNFVVGNYDFKSLVTSGAYIDKTAIIDEIFSSGDSSKILVITRPRRFGKSLMISMLNAFLDVDADSREYFKNLNIEKSKYFNEINKYDVVNLSFKDVDSESKEDMLEKVHLVFINAFNKYSNQYIKETLTDVEYSYYQKILEDNINVVAFEQALYLLIKLAFYKHNRKVFVLIDEYDLPIFTAHIHGFLDEINELFKHMYSIAFKGNLFIHTTILTGVMNNAKDSLSSGLNNVQLDNGLYTVFKNEYFAFNEDEIDGIIQKCNVDVDKNILREWYGGYYFGNIVGYNPWSIVNFFSGLNRILVYWASTGSSSMIKNILSNNNYFGADALLKLMNGEEVEVSSDFSISFKDINNSRQGAYVQLLSLGYLTCSYNQDEMSVKARIPNNEIKQVFKNEIYDRYVGSSSMFDYKDFRQAFFDGNVKKLEKYFENFLSSFSYYSFYEEKNYQILTLTLASLLFNDCVVKEEITAGDGRCDIMIVSKDKNKFGCIIELKSLKSKTSEDRLSRSANNALKQIISNDYYSVLTDFKANPSYAFGISFYKKMVKIACEKIS